MRIPLLIGLFLMTTQICLPKGQKVSKVGSVLLGGRLGNLKKSHLEMVYLGTKNEIPGQYWRVNSGLCVVAQSGNIVAIILSSSKLSVCGLKIGDSLTKVEQNLGEARNLNIRTCGGNSPEQLALEYRDLNLRIWLGNAGISRIIVLDYSRLVQVR